MLNLLLKVTIASELTRVIKTNAGIVHVTPRFVRYVLFFYKNQINLNNSYSLKSQISALLFL